jgi:hypothetical protein
MLFKRVNHGENVEDSSKENFLKVLCLSDQQYPEYWQSFVQWDECCTKTQPPKDMYYPKNNLMLLVLD